MPHKAIDIAKGILSVASHQEQDSFDMTNLKLQKLLHYCQGTYMVLHDGPLFDEEVVKWQYGPVVPDVYQQFKGYKGGVLPAPEDFKWEGVSAEAMQVIYDVYDYFGQFSAVKLMNMTHEEIPFGNTDMNEVIDHGVMLEFFTGIVNKD